MTNKEVLRWIFGIIAVPWTGIWLLSAWLMGGLMGIAWPFVVLAVAPPALLWFVMFRAAPRILEVLRKSRQS